MAELALEVNENLEENQNLSEKILETQKSFLESDIGKAVNNAIDIGLKAVLPDLIEDQIIDIKDAILENGFKEGIKEVINSAVDIGKSAIGIVTGNFENTEQIQLAIKKGGILDKTSDLLDYAIDLANDKNLIDDNITSLIKKGKDSIISTISENIEETLVNQIEAVEKLEKYCENWNVAYENKDISSMEKAYKNIENYLDKTVPLESIITQARKIENIHNLIKNNGNNFDLTEDELELAEKI